jgi:uroporphyrin-III C-methyltransferase
MNKLKNLQKIFFVGAGPGNPELITRAGWKALNNAEVVLYDALIDFNGFHKSAPKSKWINVGKRANKISIKQSFIGKILVNYSLKGYSVVRLKGGDPSVFGRISEELLVLKKMGIPYEIIPGVTAASAAAANLGISLSKRDESRSISFVTPAKSKNSSKDDNWLDTVMNSDTSVIYMAGRDRKKIAKILISKGMNPSSPIAIVEDAGSKKGYKKIISLNELALNQFFKLSGPVCLIVGKVLLDSELIGKQDPSNIHLTFNNQYERIKKFCHEK